MALFNNASPQFIALGADDKSIRSVAPTLNSEPLHFPLVPIFTRKGSTDKIATDNIEAIFGSETVDPKQPYYTHQTRFINQFLSSGNTIMVKRLIPKDAGARANIAIYMDILPTDVPNYVRNSFGDLVVVPETNDYKIDEDEPTIKGYYVKFISEYRDVERDMGELKTKPGTMSYTRDLQKLNQAINLLHYGYDLKPEEEYTAEGQNKKEFIRTNMEEFVATIDALSGVQIDEVIAQATAVVTKYNGDAANPPASKYILTDATANSVMYPILELQAKYQGDYYNNIGFTINSLTKDEIDQSIISENKALPFGLSLYTRKDKESTATVLKSLYGEADVKFCFKNDAINPTTEAYIDLQTIFENNWFNETDVLKTIRYKEYEGIYFYKDYYEAVCKNLIEAEKKYVSATATIWDDGKKASTFPWYDFTTNDQNEISKEIYVINPFTCKSTRGVKYRAIQHGKMGNTRSEFEREVSIANETPIWLQGGSDGTMNKETYENLVADYLREYNDPDSEVQDLSFNLENILYDSGFALDIKKEFINFIKLRKDTAIVLSTHDSAMGEKVAPLSEARAIAVALRTRLELAPESSFYGTGVCRGMVVCGAGKLQDGSSKDFVPLTYDIAKKAARMMGAGNGQWNMAYLFDNAVNEGNVIRELINIQPEFIPAGIKPTLWNDGIVWAQRFDRVRYHFPALQTVYDNDTSVLNSFFNMMALLYCERCGYKTWKTFTGTTNLTSGQFKDRLENFMANDLRYRFGTMITTVPEVEITEEDELLGYSWRSYINMYGNNMKTVGVHTTRVYRSSDLETQNS